MICPSENVEPPWSSFAKARLWLCQAGGVTLHMTGYAPTYTKSVEKGSFLTNDGVDVFCKKSIFFAINRTLGVPE